jgi:hypothetical protein
MGEEKSRVNIGFSYRVSGLAHSELNLDKLTLGLIFVTIFYICFTLFKINEFKEVNNYELISYIYIYIYYRLIIFITFHLY